MLGSKVGAGSQVERCPKRMINGGLKVISGWQSVGALLYGVQPESRQSGIASMKA